MKPCDEAEELIAQLWDLLSIVDSGDNGRIEEAQRLLREYIRKKQPAESTNPTR